jgi:hypothetical protein
VDSKVDRLVPLIPPPSGSPAPSPWQPNTWNETAMPAADTPIWSTPIPAKLRPPTTSFVTREQSTVSPMFNRLHPDPNAVNAMVRAANFMRARRGGSCREHHQPGERHGQLHLQQQQSSGLQDRRQGPELYLSVRHLQSPHLAHLGERAVLPPGIANLHVRHQHAGRRLFRLLHGRAIGGRSECPVHARQRHNRKLDSDGGNVRLHAGRQCQRETFAGEREPQREHLFGSESGCPLYIRY